jgi:putative restriction endonuclease
MRWVDEVEACLQSLGGEATLSQIYEEVRRAGRKPLNEGSVRQIIYDYSSDSTSWRRNPTDLFTRRIGGNEVRWALRDHKTHEISD